MLLQATRLQYTVHMKSDCEHLTQSKDIEDTHRHQVAQELPGTLKSSVMTIIMSASHHDMNKIIDTMHPLPHFKELSIEQELHSCTRTPLILPSSLLPHTTHSLPRGPSLQYLPLPHLFLSLLLHSNENVVEQHCNPDTNSN